MNFTTRFAPSPTGPLHLGHAYSALLTWDMARAANGTCLLRIEDTDQGRCRAEFDAQILEDLTWLGLTWPEPVWRQSQRLADYDGALQQLINMGLVYPCTCTRKDIREALSAPQELAGESLATLQTYPGTCRHRPMSERGENTALRLNMEQAIMHMPTLVGAGFTETGSTHSGQHQLTRDTLINEIGDIVLARRDTGAAAYHLSVVVDDAAQSISHVIRGRDLFNSTPIHVALQTILGLPVPEYNHHRLIRDEDGQRLAKRDDARAIAKYRADGFSPDDIRELVGLT